MDGRHRVKGGGQERLCGSRQQLRRQLGGCRGGCGRLGGSGALAAIDQSTSAGLVAVVFDCCSR